MNEIYVALLAGMFGGILGSGVVATIAFYKIKKKLDNSMFGGML